MNRLPFDKRVLVLRTLCRRRRALHRAHRGRHEEHGAADLGRGRQGLQADPGGRVLGLPLHETAEPGPGGDGAGGRRRALDLDRHLRRHEARPPLAGRRSRPQLRDRPVPGSPEPAPVPRPQITTDGLDAYFDALPYVFGPDGGDFAAVVKLYGDNEYAVHVTGKPDPAPHQHLLRGAALPDDAHVDPPAHQADQLLLEEAGEPTPRCWR